MRTESKPRSRVQKTNLGHRQTVELIHTHPKLGVETRPVPNAYVMVEMREVEPPAGRNSLDSFLRAIISARTGGISDESE